MRELKFRAWDEREKKYIVKGFSIIGEVTVFDMLNQQKDHSLKRLKDILVEQYTGLKDKKGEEIYEGDIILYTMQFYYSKKSTEVVSYDPTIAAYILGDISFVEEFNEEHIFPDIEVIGNIHENPELLNKKEVNNV